MANDIQAFYRQIGLFIEAGLAEMPDWSDAITGSGILTGNPTLSAAFRRNGGKVNEVPFWKPQRVDADLPYYVNNTEAVLHGVGSKSFKSVLLERKIAYSFTDNDINVSPAGVDVNSRIITEANMNMQYNNKKMLLSILQGVFASADMSTHVIDKSADTNLKISDIIIEAGRDVLGDMASQLKIIFAHSKIVSKLVKENSGSLQAITGLDGQTTMLTRILGYTVVEDDDVPYNTGTKVGSIYMMTPSSVYTENIPTENSTELERDGAIDSTNLYFRWSRIIHPNGMDWEGATGVTPTNAELATGTSWKRRYETKNVPFVEVKVGLA